MAKNIEWKLVDVDKSLIKANPNNPKITDEKGLRRLERLREKYGTIFDGILNADYSLIDGHSRLKQTPTGTGKYFIPSRQLSEDDYKELNALFDLARAGEPDLQLIETTFGEEFMEEWDLDRPTFFLEARDDDFDRAAPKKSITEVGDIYELDNHRLLCGDSTKAADVEKLLAGKEPYLMVTDPPYGVNYDPQWRDGLNKWSNRATGKVANDDRADWTEAWKLSPAKVAYVWHSGKFTSVVQPSLEAADFIMRSQIIWVKNNQTFSRGDYHWKHEPCLYMVKKGSAGNWAGDRKQTTVWEIANNNPIGRKSKDPNEEQTGHGTQKPIECMAKPIRNHDGDVYDPFLGSGTTMIASDQMGRKCFGMDLDPKYCDVVVARFIKFKRHTEATFTIKRNGKKLSKVEIEAFINNTNVQSTKERLKNAEQTSN